MTRVLPILGLVLLGLVFAWPASGIPTTTPSLPDCSPTGEIRLHMDVPEDEDPVRFNYRVDDGPTQEVPTTDDTATLRFAEGRYKLEYWGQTTAGPDDEHQIGTVLVDQTKPNLSVQSDQGQRVYVRQRRATVSVEAGDALSGLVGDPSAVGARVPTATRGPKSVEWTATDRCGNTTTEKFDYRVLGPGFGTRAVIEETSGNIRVRLPGTRGARASQKGQGFTALREPREIPVGTVIDTRRGRARLTSSRNQRDALQDGVFYGGVFQALQSRRRQARGLTELRLRGSSFRRRCGHARRAKGSVHAARHRRRVVRRLRSNARGRFRTRGRHSAATVRGTVWLTVDRCDGTLTKVTRGRVAVRDFRRKRTIVVRAGKRYLARAHR